MPNRIRKRPRKRLAAGSEILRLVSIMAKLRGKNGCPWDRVQTHKSLLPYLIEETYELRDALLSGKSARMQEELGDVLLQVVFHAQLAAEADRFDLADVAGALCDKLVSRHPHVFGSARRKLNADQVLAAWERLKRSEGRRSRSVLGGLPGSLPALLRAFRMQEKVAQFGFDWPDVRGVERKLREETDEFHRALRKRDRTAQTEELGDLLFTLVNLARHLGVDPETALNAANDKFARRFQRVEASLRRQKIDLSKAGLKVLEAAWQASKQPVRSRPAKQGSRPGTTKPRRTRPHTAR
jgi:tetrapyrrole methylase family protein/MazG family protein